MPTFHFSCDVLPYLQKIADSIVKPKNQFFPAQGLHFLEIQRGPTAVCFTP